MKKTLKFVIFVLVLVLIGLVVFVVKNSFEKSKTREVSKIIETKSESVPIAMAADNNYAYPTLVAMTSVLENAGSNTKYDFYLMVPSNFTDENKNIIKSLEKKYERCSINIIDMGNAFKEANSDSRITTPSYYRLNLSELLPNLDKIIWLDGDTVTFKDLTDMISIDMKGYHYKGFLDNNINGTKSFGVDDDHYICAGVMLINLHELRKDKMQEKFSKFVEENNDKLVQHDQTVINVMCSEKIGILPPKFGIWNFENEEVAKMHNDSLKIKSKYDEEEFLNSYKNPAILHYAGGGKPWKDNYAAFKDKWWDYAKKTDYYDVILKVYS